MKYRYKALMCNNFFVDTNLLEKGVYQASIPKLYDLETTMEKLIAETRAAMEITRFQAKQYFDNLAICELVTVELEADQNPLINRVATNQIQNV